MQYIAVGETDPVIYTRARLDAGRGAGPLMSLYTGGTEATVRLGGALLTGCTDLDLSDASELAAAAAEGDVEVTISDQITLSAVKGDLVLLIDADTLEEIVCTVRARPSATRVVFAEPLPRAIATASEIQCLTMGVRLPSTAVAEGQAGLHGVAVFETRMADPQGLKRVRWEESFRIVRRVSSIVLTPTRLTQLYPSVRSMRGTSDVDYEEAIQASWDVVMVPMLAAKSILHEDVITDDVLEPLHAVATVLHLARQWRGVEPDYVARLETLFESTKATTFARIDLAVRDQTEETPSEVAPGAEPRRDVMRVAR